MLTLMHLVIGDVRVLIKLPIVPTYLEAIHDCHIAQVTCT